jgi:hypothetical protein
MQVQIRPELDSQQRQVTNADAAAAALGSFLR